MRMDYWDESMLTGFPEIDNTYRLVAEHLAAIRHAATLGNNAVVTTTLSATIHLLEAHFVHEERLMSQHGYHLLDQHRRVHNTFLRQLRRYEERQANGEDASRKITYDLKIWLTNHVKLQDGHFAKFTRERRRGPIKWLAGLLGS